MFCAIHCLMLGLFGQLAFLAPLLAVTVVPLLSQEVPGWRKALSCKRALLLLALLSLAAPLRAETMAEDTDLSPVELPPVTVEEKALRGESLTLPAPEVQARELMAVPGGTNLIDESRYRSGRTATLDDMLLGQPGVLTHLRGGGDEMKISIRGSGLDRNYHLRGIRLLQDGVPMNQADGNADYQWLEPMAIRNVEVYRGGNALQMGATTLGGAINVVSPTGYTAFPLQIRAETGSYGYIKGQISSGMVLGNLDYYASAAASYQNGFQRHSRGSSQRYNLNIGYRIRPNLETRLLGGFVYSRLQLPGTLTMDEVRGVPRRAAPNALGFDQQHNILNAYLANKTTWQLADDQQLEATLYAVYHRLDHPLFWNAFFLNGLGVLDQRSKTYGGNFGYRSDRNWLGRKNRLVVGFNPQLGVTDSQRFRNLSGRKRGMRTEDSDQFAANLDFYAENSHYLLDRLALVTGSQLSYAVRNYDDHFNRNPNGNQSRNQDYLGISPKAGLLFEITPDTQVFANYTRSFEPPTMLETVGTGGVAGNVLTRSLKAQTADTMEFGTRGRHGRAAWDITYYHAWVHNELLTLNDTLGNTLGTVNAGQTRHKGLEAGLSLTLAEGLFNKETPPLDYIGNITAVGPNLTPENPGNRDRLVLRQVYNWTSLHFANDDVYGNNRLPGLSPHMYRGELTYEHPCGFYVQPNVEWSMTRFPVDYANTMYIHPYALLGVRAGYRSRHGWSAFVEFRNLTNKRYPSSVQVVADARTGGPPRIFYPGQGFSVYGGLEWRR